jgi:UDP-N-acetyl-D-glucosamine dehydrogenase
MDVDVLVVGLGYVGLPLVQAAARSGLKVMGLEVNAAVADGLNAGRSHVDDLSDADIREILDLGFAATTDEDVLARAETVVVCVPTPLSPEGGPDLSAVNSAMSAIGRHLRKGQLVVLESTTYPGTTQEVVAPLLEAASGLVAGQDFSLAFSPERIDPGNAKYGITNTPKVVGGLTPACTERAAAFYGKFIDSVVRAKGVREAEAAKLLENTYRHINIALMNEMARFCHPLGIDLWNVIDMASTKPFGFQAFRPGPGVGGHCIPIDPNYFSHRIRTQLGHAFRFVELAQEINATMPTYVADRALRILNNDGIAMKGATVLLLGVTYKADIADQRESPAVPVARELLSLGASLRYHDPSVSDWSVAEASRVEDDQLNETASTADLTILLQDHSVYRPDELAATARRFFDTRGVTTNPQAHRL